MKLPTIFSRRKKAGYTRTRPFLSFMNFTQRQRNVNMKRKNVFRPKVSPGGVSSKEGERPHVFRVFKKQKIIPTKIHVKPKENCWNQDPKKENVKIFRVVKVPW